MSEDFLMKDDIDCIKVTMIKRLPTTVTFFDKTMLL